MTRSPLTIRVVRSLGYPDNPWFLVLANGKVVSKKFATREQAEAYRQQLLANENNEDENA
jgi:hypothetical protein